MANDNRTPRTTLDAATDMAVAFIQTYTGQNFKPDPQEVTAFFLEAFKAAHKAAGNPNSNWRQKECENL